MYICDRKVGARMATSELVRELKSQVCVQLSAPLLDSLRRLAVTNDRSVAAEIRRACEAHLAAEGQR
jgi:hypothetical protein